MNFEELRETYGLKLNEAQSRAVQETEGAVLLLAVPGSGKTTVLVARLGYMILCLGIDPASVLTMTYTVAATRDMKDRFCSFFGEEWRDRVEFRTINGVCAKIIQSYEYRTGGTAFSLITDEKELSALIGAIYKDVAFDFATESDIKNIRTQITYVKNMMLSEEDRDVITLFYGKGRTEEEMTALAAIAEELSGGAEVSMISTLDPIYDLVITLE